MRSHGRAGERVGFGIDFSPDSAGALASFLAIEGLFAGDAYLLGSKKPEGTFWAVAEIRQ